MFVAFQWHSILVDSLDDYTSYFVVLCLYIIAQQLNIEHHYWFYVFMLSSVEAVQPVELVTIVFSLSTPSPFTLHPKL